jgi:hypothetical protein
LRERQIADGDRAVFQVDCQHSPIILGGKILWAGPGKSESKAAYIAVRGPAANCIIEVLLTNSTVVMCLNTRI